MPRFTPKKVNDTVEIHDSITGDIITFAATMGEQFFESLLFDLNIDDHAQHEEELCLMEHGVEVG